MKETWTPADEITFRAMQEKRKRVQTKNREPVAALASVLHAVALPQIPMPGALPSPIAPTHPVDRLTDALIENAERLRDALKPYDSNTRAAEAPAPGRFDYDGPALPPLPCSTS